MNKSQKVFYFGVLPALFFQVVGSYLYYRAFTGATAQGFYIGTKIILVAWPLLWFFVMREAFLRKREWKIGRGLLFGFLYGALIGGAILGIYFTFQEYFAQFAGGVAAKISDLGIGGSKYLLFAIFLSVVHSFLEEYYWRWFVFGGLMLRLKPLWAGIVASAAFAGHHYIVLWAFLPLWQVLLFGSLVGVGGGIWCYIYYKTGRLSANWISHLLVDMAIMYVGWLMLGNSISQ